MNKAEAKAVAETIDCRTCKVAAGNQCKQVKGASKGCDLEMPRPYHNARLSDRLRERAAVIRASIKPGASPGDYVPVPPIYTAAQHDFAEPPVLEGKRVDLVGQVSDGSTANYYELPPGATQLQELISHKNMNAQMGEIFRSSYRYGESSHSDELRDARKIKFYIDAEIARLTA